MSRSIYDLVPEVYRKCWEFLRDCEKAGLKVKVTQTLRTVEEQAELYAQGRTKPGLVVTQAKPGESWHEYGRAFDICFLTPTGKATWEGPWEQVGDIGESVGLAWGGRWKRPDRPHFEDRGGMTLDEVKKIWAAR